MGKISASPSGAVGVHLPRVVDGADSTADQVGQPLLGPLVGSLGMPLFLSVFDGVADKFPGYVAASGIFGSVLFEVTIFVG